MQIISRIDNVVIDIDVDENIQYGIMLSGGIDSAILLCLLILEAKNKSINLNLQPFSTVKHDKSYTYVTNIISNINTKFASQIPETILVGDPDVHHSIQSKYAAHEIHQKYPGIQKMWNGLNQNPPPPFDLNRWGPGKYPNRIRFAPSKNDLMPFIQLYKNHIIDIGLQFNLQFLFDITHSCTEWTQGRCMQCFQCNERLWAFQSLSIEDPGKL